MHSVSLARASCIGVFSESLRSFMRIRFDCQYSARLEVCVLKFITDRCDLPTGLCVRAQCVSYTRHLYYRVLCESPPSCMRIRLDCHYAARPEVCLKVI